MTRADTPIGAGLAIVFLALSRTSTTFPNRSEFEPGPGFLPFWLGVAGVVLSVAVAVGGVRGAAASLPDRAGFARLASTVVGLAIAIALAETVGFVAVMTLYLMFVTLVVERMRPLSGLAASIGTMALVYLVFERFLHVPFPQGPLGP